MIIMKSGPFLCSQGLAGLVTVTYVVLLHHRAALLEFRSLEDVLPFINNLAAQEPPENMMGMCTLALPVMQGQLSFKGA